MVSVSDRALSHVVKINHFFPILCSSLQLPSSCHRSWSRFRNTWSPPHHCLVGCGHLCYHAWLLPASQNQKKALQGNVIVLPLACRPLEWMHINRQKRVVCNQFMHDCVFNWCWKSLSVSCVFVQTCLYLWYYYSLRNSVRKLKFYVCFCWHCLSEYSKPLRHKYTHHNEYYIYPIYS